jgi:hypothetical protein
MTSGAAIRISSARGSRDLGRLRGDGELHGDPAGDLRTGRGILIEHAAVRLIGRLLSHAMALSNGARAASRD